MGKEYKYWISPIILIVSIIYVVYLFFISPYGKQINLNVFIGSLTALIGLLGITFQIKATKEIEAERRLHEIEINHRNTLAQIRMRSYDARKESYKQLLKPFTETLILSSKQKPIDFQKYIEEMMRSNIDIHLLGSDKTCKLWENWRVLAFKTKEDDDELQKKIGLASLIFYARLILSIRKDLGHPYTKITEIDILRSFIKDLEDYKDELKEALKWESLSDVYNAR